MNAGTSQLNHFIGTGSEAVCAYLLNGRVDKDYKNAGGSDVLGIRWNDGTPVTIDVKGKVDRRNGLYVDKTCKAYDIYVLAHQADSTAESFPKYTDNHTIRTWNMYGWCTREELVENGVDKTLRQGNKAQDQWFISKTGSKLKLFSTLYDATWGDEYDMAKSLGDRLEMAADTEKGI